jgi:hypothetical protein
VQGRGDDSVVKLRPVEPDDLPDHLRHSKNLVVEVDAMPGGYVCSASLRAKLGRTDVKEVAAGERLLRKLFSKEQRGFFADHAPDGIELDELSMLGPITVFKLNFSPQEYGRKLVAEMWLYPDYSRILELSTKCPPPDMLRVAVETRLFLTNGVSTSRANSKDEDPHGARVLHPAHCSVALQQFLPRVFRRHEPGYTAWRGHVQGGTTMPEETGQITGTKDKDYNIIWFVEQCLSNTLRLETYVGDAERENDRELAEFFRRAQDTSRKGAEQGKELLAKRLAS